MKNRITMLLAAALLGTACLITLPGCGTLAAGGAYNGDHTLYQADSVINTSYLALHGFVTFEYQNRALLASHPEVRAAADNVRLHAHDWLNSAIALREAYAANKTAANATALQGAITIIQTALTQAAALMTEYEKPAAPAPAVPAAPALPVTS
jgi:hypothetical protein